MPDETNPETNSQNLTPTTKNSSVNKFRRLFSTQLPLILTLLIIIGMLAIWKPWDTQPNASNRTLSVSGEAEITAEPDEYVFYPSYQFKSADRKAALDAFTVKTNEIVKKLKELGVPDSKIKTDTSGYGYNFYYSESQEIYTAYLTITVNNNQLAQKVQDYLLTTAPYGSVTPTANFSKAKRQQLTDEARDMATKDARAKAEQNAQNLGFAIGKVKSVDDNPNSYFNSYDDNIRISENNAAGAADSAESLPIQAGEDSLTYKVSVTYYIK